MNRARFFFSVVLISSITGILSGQNRVITDGESRHHLVYRNGMLAEISNTDKGSEKFIVSWEKGRVLIVDIRTQGQVIISRNEYAYAYDNRFRICEIRHESEYGNHYYSEYLGRKYSGNDTSPYKCYYSCQEGIDEPEITLDCNNEIRWQDIIEDELRVRSRNYQKGPDSIDYNPPCRNTDLNDPDSEFYEFLRQD